MKDENFEECLALITKAYKTRNYDETITLLRKLENDLTDHCKKNNGCDFKRIFYEPLNFIIEDTNQKISENHYETRIQDFVLVKCVLICIRNSLYKSPSNQNMICEGEDNCFLNPIISFSNIIISSLYVDDKDENSSQHSPQKELKIWLKDVDGELRAQFLNISSVCTTLFVNIMAGNSALRIRLWPILNTLTLKIICLPVAEVQHVGAALLHQFLIEDRLKLNFCSGGSGRQFIPPLLKAYMESGPNACFSLYCLEILIQIEGLVVDCWKSLNPKECLLVLDILTTLIQKEKDIFPDVPRFLKGIFKKEADKIFCTFKEERNQLDPQVTIRIASFLCYAASSDNFKKILQEDKSLLISSVYLLKGITEIGDTSNNFFSRVSDVDATEDLTNHPAFGFKSDLVRLIAALVCGNKDNQDTVRDIGGVLLILENSQYDARNPLIREASIFAIRNLLEGNTENQNLIAQLQLQGAAENEALSRLGLGISLDSGKISLHQK